MIPPVEELEALIKDYRWEHFEADPLGQIQVGNKLFCMRVGIHMDRPVQAIIADGQFVRMRSADFYKDKQLQKIDPERLAECLYVEGPASNIPMWPRWRPFIMDQNKLLGAQQQMAAAQRSQNLTISGAGGGIGGMSQSDIAKLEAQIKKTRAEIQDQMKAKAPVKSPKKLWWASDC